MTKWKKWTTLDKIGNIEKFDKVDKYEKFDKIAMKNPIDMQERDLDDVTSHLFADPIPAASLFSTYFGFNASKL